MNRWLVVILFAACGSKPESTPAAAGSGSGAATTPDGPTIPPAFADFRGPILTRDAVFLDKQRQLVRPPQLVTDRAGFADSIKHLNPTGDVTLAFTPDASAQSVLGAMRAIIETHGEVSLATIVDGKPKVVCYSKQLPPEGDPADLVQLSVSIEEGARVIGVSRIQEVETLKPPYAEFAAKLKEHKQSAFFTNREDVELAVSPKIEGAELAEVLTSLCASFHGIEPRDVTELSINAKTNDDKFSAATGTGDIGTTGDDGAGGSGGWGTIGTGRYGTIGHGTGTTSGYGTGSGSRGQMRGGGVPTVSFGQPEVVGELDKAIVRRYLKRHVNELSYCYEKQLQNKPTLSGTVGAKFAIGADGNVIEAAADGVDPEVSRCFADVIHAIEFPKPKSGSAVVSYPFQVKPAGG